MWQLINERRTLALLSTYRRYTYFVRVADDLIFECLIASANFNQGAKLLKILILAKMMN